MYTGSSLFLLTNDEQNAHTRRKKIPKHVHLGGKQHPSLLPHKHHSHLPDSANASLVCIADLPSLYLTSAYHGFCVIRRNGDLLVFWGRGHRRGVRASTLIGELQPQFIHLLHVSHCGPRKQEIRSDRQPMFGNGTGSPDNESLKVASFMDATVL